MKKTINLILSAQIILLIVIASLMLSGCVFVAKEPVVVITPDYDITCYNNTNVTITDWCVKRNNDTTYANSDYNCTMFPGKRDTIYDLPRGTYQIFFTFKQRNTLHEWDYDETGYFDLDEDVTFYVAQRDIYGRSAVTNNKADEEPQYVLVCSNGKEYELTHCN